MNSVKRNALYLSIVVSLIYVPQAAAQLKVGAKCTKVNAVTTQNGVQYICKQVGKTLSWQVKSKLPTPKPSISPMFNYQIVRLSERAMPETVFPITGEEKKPTIVPLNGSALPVAEVGKPYSLQFTTMNGSHPPYMFNVGTGFIPPGLQLDNVTGLLAGIPTRAGNYPMTIGVIDTDYLNPNSFSSQRMGKWTGAYGDFVLTVKGQTNPNTPWFSTNWAKAKSVIPYPMDTLPNTQPTSGEASLVTVGGVPAVALTALANKSFNSGGWQGKPITQASMAYVGVGKRFYSLNNDYKNQEGLNEWTRIKIFFPPDYTPSGDFQGEWNWIAEWHTDDYTQSFNGHSIALGVFPSKWDSTWRGSDSRLALRLMGGDIKNIRQDNKTCSQPTGAMKLNHWYDVVFHIIWSADPKVGKAELWIDGTQLCSTNFPTLYTHTDGTKSWTNGFGVYNYRPTTDWSSTIYFGDIAIGPTAQSIGFKQK